jgi:transposase
MAYREVAMWEILSILERVGRGESQAAIQRATGTDRKTIRRYVALARELGWQPGEAVPTEELARGVAGQCRPARGREPGEVEAVLLPHRDRIIEWLTPNPGEKRGLRLTKVHQLLERHGVRVAYSSLHRFAVEHCGFVDRRRITVRMADSAPGDLAEIDFGRLGLIPHTASGRRKAAWALIVTLAYSRHQYAHVSYTQTAQDIITGLEDAWMFFGGVVHRVVIDNMTTAVKKADRYDPIFQRTMEEYARYRGFVLDPALLSHPTGKPKVERGVSYLRDSLFRGEDWRDLHHLQRECIIWCQQTAGTRIHGTTRKRPLAVFENEEKAALQPLSAERYDPPRWAQCKVHPDHHIMVDKASYSVPTAFIGKTVSVRVDRSLVRIYYDGESIKLHPKRPPGGRSTDHGDYPQHLTPYTTRDPDRLIQQAHRHGPHIGRFVERLLSGSFPWAKLRQAQLLVRLGDKYGWARLDAVCNHALTFDLIQARRVEAILRQGLEQVEIFSTPDAQDPSVVIGSRFERPARSFSHPSSTGGEA